MKDEHNEGNELKMPLECHHMKLVCNVVFNCCLTKCQSSQSCVVDLFF